MASDSGLKYTQDLCKILWNFSSMPKKLPALACNVELEGSDLLRKDCEFCRKTGNRNDYYFEVVLLPTVKFGFISFCRKLSTDDIDSHLTRIAEKD